MLPREVFSSRRRTVLAHACVACKRPWAMRAVRTDDGAYVVLCRFCSWRQLRDGDLVEAAAGLPAAGPHSPYALAGEADHRVLFYDAQPELVTRLTAYVSEGIAAGDICVIIATGAHRAALRDRLGPTVVAAAVRRGAFVELDAGDTLDLFLRDGRPDAALYDRTVAAFIREQTASGASVRAFGEMVNLLWTRGQPRAALELEMLWNGLQRQVGFTLLCGYDRGVVAQGGAAARRLICEQHSAVAA